MCNLEILKGSLSIEKHAGAGDSEKSSYGDLACLFLENTLLPEPPNARLYTLAGIMNINLIYQYEFLFIF